MNLSLQTLADLAAFIAFASLKATVLVALVLLVQRACRRYLSAGLRYLLWASVVISLVTPIGFDTALPSALLPDVPAVSRTAENYPLAAPEPRALPDVDVRAQSTVSLPAQSARAEPPVMAEDPPFPWIQVLPYLWLAGVLGVLGAIAASSHRFAGLVRRATIAPVAVQDLLQDCMRQTACSTQVQVLHSADVQVPMIAGLFKPVLLLPQDLEQQVSRAQLRHVFIHELMHLQRGDIISNWIVALVQALHWFNPIVWFAFFCMRQDRELACDAATLQHLAPSDHAAYGHTLLRLNDTVRPSSTPPLALGMLDSSSHLEKRILMLVQSSRSRKLQSRAALLLFLPLAAVAFSQPAAREAEPAVAAEPVAAVVEPAAVARAEPVAAVTEPAMTAPPAATAEAAVTEPTRTVVEPTPAAIPVAEEVVPAAEPAAPAVAEPARSLGLVSPDAVIVAQLSERPVSAPLAVAAAVTTQVPAAEPDPDLAVEILLLADKINAARSDGIGFIEELDGAAAACRAKGTGILATLSTPCAKTRRALNRGHVLYFGYQCYLLEARQEALVGRYRQATNGEPGASSLDSALRASAANLQTFCSKDTYAQRYPAFASLVAEAESLERFKPGQRTLSTAIALTNRSMREGGAWANGLSWYDIGNGRGGGMEGTGAYGGSVSPDAGAAPAGGDSGGGGGAAPAP
jgi:beta-lactamase regulating signal transducer with metallopeptidase domain